MASKLYESIVNNSPNSIGSIPKNTNALNVFSQIAQFKKTLGNRNPKDIVENLLKTGQMSQEQFDQYSSLANQIMNGGG